MRVTVRVVFLRRCVKRLILNYFLTARLSGKYLRAEGNTETYSLSVGDKDRLCVIKRFNGDHTSYWQEQ